MGGRLYGIVDHRSDDQPLGRNKNPHPRAGARRARRHADAGFSRPLGLVRGRHATVFAALLLAAFCTYVTAHGTPSAVLDHLGQPFVLEFDFNVLVHRSLETGIASRISLRVSIWFVAASVAAIATLQFLCGAPAAIVRVAGWGAPASVLIIALVALDLNGRSVTSTSVAALGAASYSIYLLHPYVIGVATKVAGVRADLNTPRGILVTIAIMTAACACGYACHAWIERPIVTALHRRMPRPRKE